MKYRKIIKYLAIAKINSQSRTVHSANLIARCGALIFRIWMFSQLYMVSYQSLGKTTIGSLTFVSICWVVMFVQCFRAASRPRVSEIIDETVKNGLLANSLNKPYSFILFHYFSFLGRMLPGMLFNVFVGLVIIVPLAGLIQLSWPGILCGGLLLFLGYSLGFFIEFSIGLSAFWLEDTTATDWIYQRIQYIFGGVVVPLAVFPDSLATIVELLPFSHLYYSAAQIIVHFDIATFFKFLTIQCCWLICMTLLALFLFVKGIKHVAINGG